jgi:hypothetical protein
MIHFIKKNEDTGGSVKACVTLSVKISQQVIMTHLLKERNTLVHMSETQTQLSVVL